MADAPSTTLNGHGTEERMTHESNRDLENALEAMLTDYRKASTWVHDEAQLEATGEVIMGDLVSGDLRTVERFLDWIRTFDGPLPVKPHPGSRPHNWTLTWDDTLATNLDTDHLDVLQAMDHLLFGGKQPPSSSTAWEALSSLGLPPGLREDLEQS
jgi:hypothetical protein